MCGCAHCACTRRGEARRGGSECGSRMRRREKEDVPMLLRPVEERVLGSFLSGHFFTPSVPPPSFLTRVAFSLALPSAAMAGLLTIGPRRVAQLHRLSLRPGRLLSRRRGLHAQWFVDRLRVGRLLCDQ